MAVDQFGNPLTEEELYRLMLQQQQMGLLPGLLGGPAVDTFSGIPSSLPAYGPAAGYGPSSYMGAPQGMPTYNQSPSLAAPSIVVDAGMATVPMGNMLAGGDWSDYAPDIKGYAEDKGWVDPAGFESFFLDPTKDLNMLPDLPPSGQYHSGTDSVFTGEEIPVAALPGWGLNISPDSVGVSWGVPKDLPTQDPTGGISWPSQPTTDLPVSDIVKDIIPLPGIPEGLSQPEIDVETQVDTFSGLGGIPEVDVDVQAGMLDVGPTSMAMVGTNAFGIPDRTYGPTTETVPVADPNSYPNMATAYPVTDPVSVMETAQMLGSDPALQAGDDFFGDGDVSGDYSQALADIGVDPATSGMAEVDFERFLPGEDLGMVDPTWGGQPGHMTTDAGASMLALGLPLSLGARIGTKVAPAVTGVDQSKRSLAATLAAMLASPAVVTTGAKIGTKAKDTAKYVEHIFEDGSRVLAQAGKSFKDMIAARKAKGLTTKITKSTPKGTKFEAALPAAQMTAAQELVDLGVTVDEADVSEMISQVDTFKDIPVEPTPVVQTRRTTPAPAQPAGPTPAEIAAAAQAEKDRIAQISAANAAANALAAANARAKTAAANRAKVAAQKAAADKERTRMHDLAVAQAAARHEQNVAAAKAKHEENLRVAELTRQAFARQQQAAAQQAQIAREVQAAKDRVDQAIVIMARYAGTDRDMSPQEQAIVAAAQVDTFAGMGAEGPMSAAEINVAGGMEFGGAGGMAGSGRGGGGRGGSGGRGRE
jgi:hypothetical protein